MSFQSYNQDAYGAQAGEAYDAYGYQGSFQSGYGGSLELETLSLDAIFIHIPLLCSS